MSHFTKDIKQKDNPSPTNWGQPDIALDEPIKERSDKETQSQKSKPQDLNFSKIAPSQPEQKVKPTPNNFNVQLQPKVVTPKMSPTPPDTDFKTKDKKEQKEDKEEKLEPKENSQKEFSITSDDESKNITGNGKENTVLKNGDITKEPDKKPTDNVSPTKEESKPAIDSKVSSENNTRLEPDNELGNKEINPAKEKLNAKATDKPSKFGEKPEKKDIAAAPETMNVPMVNEKKEGDKKEEKVEFKTEDPGQILEQMKDLPPITAYSAYDQAQTASTVALDKQRSDAQEGLPELQAPTGLSPIKPESDKKEGVKSSLDEKPLTDFQGEKSGKEGPDYKTNITEIAPPLSIKPTRLLSSNDSKPSTNDTELSQSAQNEFDSICLNSDLVSTSAGERPTVDMTGESDPSQIQSFQGESDSDVQKAKMEASQEMYKDFGENDIYPKPIEKKLKSGKILSGSKAPKHGKVGKPLIIPPEAVSGLNLSFGPTMADRIGEQKDQYDVGKTKYEIDSAKAKADADQQIITLNKETSKQQIDEQKKAKSEVLKDKEEWKSELDKVDKDYQEKASKASSEQKQKIETEKQTAEEKSAKHLDEAEKKAEEEKVKKEKEAEQKKDEKKKESKGFWGWVKSAASALIDGLKAAVNFIYDTLRSAVKLIFEAVKFLVKSVIEAARFVITGLIKAFGFILKGLVSIVFAAFPEIAKKINDKIDKAVNIAVEGVNKAAQFLSDAVCAVLDFVANLIDSVLGLIQSIYNGIFTVLGMIVRGEFGELMSRLGNLVDAAKAMPDKFETAAYEELLGGNLDEPLSAEELKMAGKIPPSTESSITGTATESKDVPSKPWTTDNVCVDQVDNNMELSPDLEKELSTKSDKDGVVEFGESQDKSRTMESVMSEVTGSSTEGPQAEQKKPDDGLSPRQRAEVKWELMKKGLADWWDKNKVAIIVGAIAAIVGVIALIIVTGGAILGAIPPIMSVLGPLFIGLTVATIAGHVKDYVSKSWDKDVQGGAKSLAKALAAGAVELITWLTFKAGGAAIKGAKAMAKGGVALAKGTVTLAKGAMGFIARGAKFIIEKGKVLFKGILESGIAKRLKNIGEFGKKLLDKLRFKKFRIRLEGRWFKLEGFINPWVLLATGEIKNVPSSELKGKRVGDVVKIAEEEGIIIGWRGSSKGAASRFVKGVKGEAGDAARLFDELSALDKKKLLAKIGKSGKSTYELRKGIPPPHPDFYQAHHIIPEELIGNSKLKGFLDEIGFNFQKGAHNGVLLPPDNALRVKGWMKSTIHSGSHPNYTKRIATEVENLRSSYHELLESGVHIDDAKKIIGGKLDGLLTNTRNNLLLGVEQLN